jgi:hypothetical protein
VTGSGDADSADPGWASGRDVSPVSGRSIHPKPVSVRSGQDGSLSVASDSGSPFFSQENSSV